MNERRCQSHGEVRCGGRATKRLVSLWAVGEASIAMQQMPSKTSKPSPRMRWSRLAFDFLLAGPKWWDYGLRISYGTGLLCTCAGLPKRQSGLSSATFTDRIPLLAP
jgi:hypothetical protein